jgi:hydroxymethylglutaryl-CoA lyase
MMPDRTNKTVHIYEVSPRDGLQNESTVLSTGQKLELIQRLIASGIRDIEVTSFVRPSWIPQLSDASDLVASLPKMDDVRYWGLIPNRRGLERAIDCGLDHVATFLSASETHNQKNLNRTQRETLAAQTEVIRSAKAEDMTVRAYISTVFGCPYEGAVSVDTTIRLAHSLREAGADIIVLGDTVGMANPDQVTHVIHALVDSGLSIDDMALHMHDTRGTAIANVVAGLKAGIRTFDGSAAGVGGCPYAPGAAGNAASEDIIHVLDAMGWSTGVDLDGVAEAGVFLADALGRDLPGRMHQVYRARTQAAEFCSA